MVKPGNGKGRWIVLVLLACMACGLIFWKSKSEPRYAGKPLSFWVHQLPCTIPADTPPGWREVPTLKYMGQQYGASNSEAILAIQSIGTNSLPYLLQLLGKSDGDAKKFVAQTMREQHLNIPEGFMQFSDPLRWQATTAFRILGTNAAVATNALRKISRELEPVGGPASLILEGFGTNNADRWFDAFRTNNSAKAKSEYYLPVLAFASVLHIGPNSKKTKNYFRPFVSLLRRGVHRKTFT